MDAKRINEIKARCEAATTGPWLNVNDGYITFGRKKVCIATSSGANAEFVANSRQDIPALLADNAAKDAEIERLTARLDALERALEEEATCTTCIHRGKAETEIPCWNCYGEHDFWQFDEARFAAEKEADCEGNI